MSRSRESIVWFWAILGFVAPGIADDVTIAHRSLLSVDLIAVERIPLGEPDDYKPCVARLPDGELLLTAFHQHKREGNRVLEQTLLFRSSDGGKSWSEPESLDLPGREPYLTVLKDGTVFITGHLLAADVRNRWGYTTGFVHRSTDRGKTWTSLRIESEAIKPAAGNPEYSINGPVTSAISTLTAPAKLSFTPMARPRSAVCARSAIKAVAATLAAAQPRPTRKVPSVINP